MNFSNRNIIKHDYSLTFSKYKLSALSIDLLMSLISEINNEDKEFNIYEFKLSDLEKKLNKKIEKKYLINAARELRNTEIIITNEDQETIITSWVTTIIFNSDNSKSTIFKLKIDNDLKPYLLQLKNNFVLYYLNEISSLQSEYTKRIYTLFRQKAKIKKFKINVEYLMNILCVPESYNQYKIFKSRVINNSIKNINEKTSLDVSFKEVKNGRKVIELEFFIKEKKNNKKFNNKNGVKALNNWLEK